MGVYGPAHHEASPAFLAEISDKVATCRHPVLMGGDFNLLRCAQDKNNDHINWSRVDLFNKNIAAWALIEVPRTGARYTWSNKQRDPVRCVLDRVLFAPELDAL